MLNSDNKKYLKFTSRSRLDRAIHTLEGLLRGVAMDGKVNDIEVGAISQWMDEYRVYANVHPFNEVVDKVLDIIQDGAIDEEEKADILWLCGKYTSPNRFFDDVTSDMQRLQAICGGITADGELNEKELVGLQAWIDQHQHLRTLWPYDEFESLLMTVLRDGKIDQKEHAQMMAFFQDFTDLPGNSKTIELPSDDQEDSLVGGVCAVCPEIVFEDRTFCFTGKSERVSRDQLAAQVASRGGRFSKTVTKAVNYLVIGADGNPCWTYCCYGRKVEQAVTLRRKGTPILIVHEHDYWDAILDSEP
jgi:hypothetical protein